MKRRNNFFAFIILNFAFCIFNFEFLSADTIHPGAGSTSANFLKIGVGARAIGMAGAFSALADDVSCLYWNPAGIVQLSNREMVASHNEGFENIRYGFVGYMQPITSKLVPKKHFTIEEFLSAYDLKVPVAINAVGVSVMTLYMPSDLERRSGENEKIYDEINPYDPITSYSGTFGAYDLAAMMTYGQRITDKLAIGINFKLINQVIDVNRAYGLGVDLGMLYQHDLSEFAPDPKSWLRYIPYPSKGQLSVVLQNFGPGIKFIERVYNLPANLKFGLSETFLNDRLNLGFDVNIPNDNFVNIAFGGEYYLPLNWLKSDMVTKGKNGVMLRAGYKLREHGNPLGGLSGLALGFGVAYNNLQLDYAFVPFGSQLGNTHQVSLIIRFLEKKKKSLPAKFVVSETKAEEKKTEENKLSNITTKVSLRPVRVSTDMREYEVNTEINNSDLSNIMFHLRTRLLNSVKIDVEQPVFILPEIESQLAGSEVFRTLVVKTNIQDSILSGTQFSYRVDKPWIKDKNVNLQTIVLNGVIEGKVAAMVTENLGEDENYYYFSSKSDRFVQDLIITGIKNISVPVVEPVPAEVLPSTSTVPMTPSPLTPATTSQQQ